MIASRLANGLLSMFATRTISQIMNITNPILPAKRKNPYWNDAEAEFTNNEARRELRAKLRARRHVNFILGSVLFHAITGTAPIVTRPKSPVPVRECATIAIPTEGLL